MKIKIESVRSEVFSKEVNNEVATFNKTKCKRTDYLKCDTRSSQFLTALSDILGIMLDRVILEAFHQYLEQASLVTQTYVEGKRYIGRCGCESVVDVYGDVVTRSNLGGGDYNQAHDELKTMANSISGQAEPHNIFYGKISGERIERYMNLH